MKRAVLILTALGLSAAAWGSAASPLPQTDIPVPDAKPLGYLPQTSAPEAIMTGAIPRTVAPINGDLKSGLDALSAKNPLQAISLRDGWA